MSSSPASYRTFADAYNGVIGAVLSEGQGVREVMNPSSIGSGFGAKSRPFRELTAFAFVIESPTDCLVRSSSRAMNLEYALAQWTWTMAGSDDVAAISYYNPRGWSFSEDGQSLRGAFGHRLRRAEGVDQLELVIDRLRRDTASRREVAVVSLPIDLKSGFRDQPCLISLQFLLREEALHLIVMMRSQSACLVLPYDASLFMMLQCWMASRLSVAVGRYIHFSGSLHIYDDELELAQTILDGKLGSVSLGKMPEAGAQTDDLIVFEAKLRSAVLALDDEQVRKLATTLPSRKGDFFCNTKRVFAVGAAARLGCHELESELVGKLPGDWRTLISDAAPKISPLPLKS